MRHLPSSVQDETLRRQAGSGYGAEQNFWQFPGAGKTEIGVQSLPKRKGPVNTRGFSLGLLKGYTVKITVKQE